jgi:signal transduction histidine kinase/DNA-binding response OmpR family regulator
MSTPHAAQPTAQTGIARRVLIIEKEKTHHEALNAIAGAHGWEVSRLGRLEDGGHHPGPAAPYLHCIDSAFHEDDIKSYVERLRRQDAAHTVLALCDDSTRPRALALLRHGVYDWLQQPFDPEELLRVLERSHERARFAREIETRGREAEALEQALATVVRTAKKIARHHSLADYCRALMQELAGMFGADGGSIYLVEGDKLVRVHTLDPGHAPDEISLPPAADSFLGIAHRTGQPVLATDIRQDKLAAPSGFPDYKKGSCLVLPVYHNGEELVAFVNLHGKKTAAFTHRDKLIGTALAAVSAGFLRALRRLSDSRERESRYEHFFTEGLTINFIAAEDGRVILANSAFHETLCPGVDPGATGPVTEYFPKRGEWAALVRRLKKEKRIDHFETEMIACDGGRRLLFGSVIANAGDDGVLVSVSAALFDVTQKKLLERELAHSIKMEAIGRLAGGVAHDFNNLITALFGYCEVLRDRVTDREALEEIEGIRSVGEKATLLTRQLLALTRKRTQAAEALDLSGLVRELDRLLVRVIGEDVALTSSFPPDETLVLADRGEIEQVIMNLVVNARDALPKGGAIRVDIVDETIMSASADRGIPPGRYVVLRVSDTGHGMDEATQRHLFEPFFSTKGKDKGTGLGLSMVYGIVKRAGGFIDVKSAPGRGSTFSLFFPKMKKPKAGDKPVTAAKPPSPGYERVLIVDDEKVVRLIMARILQKYGYRVCEAADGETALALAAQAQPAFDIALIDMIMPGMSGVELASRLKTYIPALKVLYVSGYAPEEIGQHGGAGVRPENLITKPFPKDSLARKVREMLDRGEDA